MYKIGILGCNGNIGSLILEKISKFEDNYIYAVSRNNNKNVIKRNNVQYTVFDIENNEKLNDFISRCQVVINCTGKYKTNIIDICIKNGVDYIDPSFIDIDSIDKTFKRMKSNCIICSAGCNPGLTEILTKYINEKFNPEMCEILFSGNGNMSKSAVEELLDISMEHKSIFRSFIKSNNLEKMEYWDMKRNLGYLCGDVVCIPVINQAFFRCIKNTDINIAYFYNTFKSEKILSKLIEAKITIEKENYNKIISDIEQLFEKEKESYGSLFTSFHCNLSNTSNAQKDEKIILESKMDWNNLTAVVVVEVITLLKQRKYLKFGIGEVWEVFDCCEIIDDFLNKGYVELKKI